MTLIRTQISLLSLFPVKSYTIGAEIKVTYSALVNEKRRCEDFENSATLTYSNNPIAGTENTTTPVEETVYSSKIVIDKYEKDSTTTKLEGAEFVLYKEVTPEGETTATKQYYKWNDTAKKVEWVNTIANATTVKTDKNGAASFDGLADGTYYLVETKAPAGYNLLEKPVKVEVKGGTTETALTVIANVANQAGTLLPSTGGMGTTIFYVLGSALVLGAVVLLVTKKRMGTKD